MIETFLEVNSLPYNINDFKAKGGNNTMNADRKWCYKFLHSHGWTIQQIADAFGRDKSTIWSSLKGGKNVA
jgi:hypothetical protein